MKKDFVREVGKSTLAVASVAVCGITFVLVSIPIMSWLLNIIRPMGWLVGNVGCFIAVIIFSLSLVPTGIAYYFIDKWYQKMTDDGCDD